MQNTPMRKANREVQNPRELEQILEHCDACRIAFFDEDYPYIVPLSFGYSLAEQLTLYFHCAKDGKKLDLLRKNPKVCFQMDCSHELKEGNAACDYSMNYESIIGWGEISIEEDEQEKRRGLDCLMRHYGRETQPNYKPEVLAMTAVLKLTVSHFTGKRLNK